MALRRGIILALCFFGGMLIGYGTPSIYRLLTFGALLFLLAYVYAELTRIR